MIADPHSTWSIDCLNLMECGIVRWFPHICNFIFSSDGYVGMAALNLMIDDTDLLVFDVGF